MIIEFIGIWIYSYMLMWINPLNNPVNPESKLAFYNPENIKMRDKIRQEIQPDEIVIVWETLWMIICPTMTAIGGLIIVKIIQNII